MGTNCYLAPGEPGSFDGLKKQEVPDGLVAWRECSRCQGYGRYNMVLDAYGPQRHFCAICNVCFGIGYLPGTCVHEWATETQGTRPTLRLWRCLKCDAVREIDSSD